jgi:hypothetical protein
VLIGKSVILNSLKYITVGKFLFCLQTGALTNYNQKHRINTENNSNVILGPFPVSVPHLVADSATGSTE